MRKLGIKMVLLWVMMFSVALTACTNGGGNGNTGNSSNTGGTNNETPPSSEMGKEDGGESGREVLTLNWFVHSNGDAVLPQGDQDFIRKTIEEKFSVKLNIQHMPMGTDYESKLSLLMASGDTPDLFASTGIASQKFIADGVTADLTPFISPQTMPNYFKWVSELELERYGVENKFARAPLVFPRNVYRSYYIRQDWLDNLALEMPTNYEEMMEVARAFTFDDPDGNNRDDTYGLGAAGNGTSVSWDFPQWIKNGLIGALMVKDNKYVDNQSDLSVQNVLQDIKDMMEEGTVDPDWFLTKGTEHIDKAAGGKVGIIVGGTRNFAFDSDPTSLQNRTKAIQPEANWMPFHPFAETGTWTENLPDTAFMFSSKTAEQEPKKLERQAQILDWMASEEGFLLINYGQEGKHYIREGNQIRITEEHVSAVQKDIIEQGNFQQFYQFFYLHNPEADPLGLEIVDERLSERDQQIIDTIKSYKLYPSIGTNVAPPSGFNLADFRAKMREYQVQILFDEPDASNWPTYHEELMTEYGGQQMIDTYEEQIRAAGIIQ
ncbi:hypothetical protein [Marinicrinis lubricantis]|uniref:ABC transporter substrate-binding protein n=1 Tax=Marinicrinis lubricantis TaxID=2086470 RepID=A0ABW1IS57_9BACL